MQQSAPVSKTQTIALSCASCFDSTTAWLGQAAITVGKAAKEAFEALGKFFASLGPDLKGNFSKVFASLKQWIHANPRGSAAVAGAFAGAAVVLLIIAVVTAVKWCFSKGKSATDPKPDLNAPSDSKGPSNPNAGDAASAGNPDITPLDEAPALDEVPPKHEPEVDATSATADADAAGQSASAEAQQPETQQATGTENANATT